MANPPEGMLPKLNEELLKKLGSAKSELPFSGGLISSPETTKYLDIMKKLDLILEELDVIKNKQISKDGYYFKNGIWRK